MFYLVRGKTKGTPQKARIKKGSEFWGSEGQDVPLETSCWLGASSAGIHAVQGSRQWRQPAERGKERNRIARRTSDPLVLCTKSRHRKPVKPAGFTNPQSSQPGVLVQSHSVSRCLHPNPDFRHGLHEFQGPNFRGSS